METPDLVSILEELKELCRQTGEFIGAEIKKVAKEDVATKSLNSLVSYVDKEAEKKLVKALRSLLPQAGFIAEEGTGSAVEKGYNWIIDPLDGTTNYLHQIPVYAVSVALVKNDEPQLGVVYEVGQKELFSAQKGEGAFLNGKPIKVSDTPQLEDSLLATGFPYYDFNRMDSFLALLKDLFENTRGLRRLGSAATDLAYVACGRFGGFFEYGLSPWDVAAGALIVEEAGGMVSDFKGVANNYLYSGEILASSKPINKALQLKLDQFMN
jgi:myo-inositol-1(or 4)-monophosphatase